MYNEVADKRHRLLKQAFEYLQQSQELLYDAMYDEADGSVMLSMELWTGKMSEILDDLVSYTNDPEDDESIANDFLYSR